MWTNNSPVPGAMTHPTQQNLSTDVEQARLNAKRSKAFVDLMERQRIKLHFSLPSNDGVIVADATQNPTNAYKVRGALVSAEMAKAQGQTTLVTASAGNHGAGLAYAAQQMGLEAVVYVPTTAPKVKVQTIRGFGAQVRLVGNSFDECLKEAQKDASVKNGEAKFVHPFDDEMVVAGQGTIGFELLEHLQHYIFQHSVGKVRVVLPIGGGGLTAGVVSVLKTHWPKNAPPLEVFGVIDESSPASLVAMLRGRPVRALTDTIADGTKVELVGENFLKVAHLLDGLVLLPHDELVQAMRTYESETSCRLEGAGALALGGEAVLRRLNLLNDPVGTLSVPLITGKNIDPQRFEEEVSAAVRMDTTIKRRQGFKVVFPEQPGQLLRFLESVQAYNIASLTYVRKVNSHEGHLRVEFEVNHEDDKKLTQAIEDSFPGSKKRMPGKHLLYRGGKHRTQSGTESLVTLEDHPGSFFTYVKELTEKDQLGSVDFLYYRKPAKQGALSQVVMGVATPPPHSFGLFPRHREDRVH